MRRSFRVMVSVALVAAFSGVGSVATAQPPDPFIGHWQATDNDGSNLSLSISGGPHRVTLVDDLATGCIVDSRAVALGAGTVSGSVIDIVLDVHCIADGTVTPFSIPLTLVDDTLVDFDSEPDVIFSRTGP